MDFSKEVARTWNSKLTNKEQLSNAALGIAGESGEVVDEIKKYLYHGKALNMNNIYTEIGDTLFYLQALLNVLPGIVTLEQCQGMVVDKLRKRHPDGFSGDYHKEQAAPVSNVEVYDS